MSKKVALVVAHEGFQPLEYGEPKKVLETAGVTVVTVSDQPGTAVSKFGDTTTVDVTLSDMSPAEYDGVFLIGGPGALKHLNDKKTQEIMKMAATSGKPWGAICISPRILAEAGLLQGKHFTGWNHDNELEKISLSAGAWYVQEPVVVDGTLITADGPESAKEFGEAILMNLP
jgi:protease I